MFLRDRSRSLSMACLPMTSHGFWLPPLRSQSKCVCTSATVPQLQDANDEMVLEAAINGRADAIVTHNVRDFLPAAHHFGIEVLTPGRIIKERLTP
jgi:predicted nucleic acid-binding protein